MIASASNILELAEEKSANRLYLVGLGSNQGDCKKWLRYGLQELVQGGGTVFAVSPRVLSSPMGPQDQPDFENACIWLSWAGAPESLLSLAQSIEAKAGRERSLHWGPRTLDIDLLWWSGGEVQTEHLSLPHPGLPKRDFVCVPALRLPMAKPWLKLVETDKETKALVHTILEEPWYEPCL